MHITTSLAISDGRSPLIPDENEKYNLSLNDLPKILSTDPAIEKLNAKESDVIKIIRDSPTAGKSIYYRVVING